MPLGQMALYVNLVTPASLPLFSTFLVLHFLSKQAGPQALCYPSPSPDLKSNGPGVPERFEVRPPYLIAPSLPKK
jgi:hypothetical protein